MERVPKVPPSSSEAYAHLGLLERARSANEDAVLSTGERWISDSRFQVGPESRAGAVQAGR